MTRDEVTAAEASDGTWTVSVAHVAVRSGLTRKDAEWWTTRLPQEVVADTRLEHDYRNRGVARERITGQPYDPPVQVQTPMGVVRASADGWGFGLYEGDYRYWFRAPVAEVFRPGTPGRSKQGDLEWIQQDGLPVIGERTLVWVGLNPSRSDDNPKANRVTLSKVLRWASEREMNAVVGVNLYAFRHTDPKMLHSREKVVGEHNDRILAHALSGPGTVLAAWGAQGSKLLRGQEVRLLIADALCLGLCSNGEPKHPARLAAATPLVPLPQPVFLIRARTGR